ncbi:hypothetical protein [Pseudaestuariivita atlantica]|uniref:50S ribosomal protein L35 n=1 Tax=Pseudaestuariivita atlantica TaxID=1317121 RepID=A0A0L1JRZ6_9RHOB|nr:hypothetical protein [Pseudaestuariivita atlantica]KNG94467.1 hypothetical protein ATO11_08865 [Pseudaestuariivita atlantica]
MTLEPDLALVIGLVVGAFSIPAIVSALSEARAPRVAAITVLIAGGLVAYALATKPGGYTLEQIPDVFVKVVAQLIG